MGPVIHQAGLSSNPYFFLNLSPMAYSTEPDVAQARLPNHKKDLLLTIDDYRRTERFNNSGKTSISY